jgi:predicted N-acetyltransferase YhbS
MGTLVLSGGAVAFSSLNAGDAVTITREQSGDIAAHNAVLARAMSPRWKKKPSQKLRQGRLPAAGLAFVARDSRGVVFGTVRLWDIQAGIDPLGRPVPALLLGPLAVDPGAKCAGIGSMLMRNAIAKATSLGRGAVLLVGDPPYYGRFGFNAEKTGALAMPGPVERDRFLALELVDGWLEGAAGMLVATGRKQAEERRVRLAA